MPNQQQTLINTVTKLNQLYAMLLTWWGGLGCRVAVPSQGDPVAAITCISHPSSQATAKAQAAAPAAELQLEGLTGDDEGLEGGLEEDLEGHDRGPCPTSGAAAAFVTICMHLVSDPYTILVRSVVACTSCHAGGTSNKQKLSSIIQTPDSILQVTGGYYQDIDSILRLEPIPQLMWQYRSSCGTGGGENDADACSSGHDQSGHQVVFMWQVGQSESHYREAVSGAHVHRSAAFHPVLLTQP